MCPSILAPTHGTSGVVGDSFMECVDWRSQMQTELRQTSVDYLKDTLKKHLLFSGPEGLQEIERIALSFEENIYATSISQSDYIRKITLKRQSIQNPIPNAMTSNVVSNSVNPSDQVIVTQRIASEVMQQLNNQGRPHTIHVPSNYTLPEQQQQMMSQRMQGLSLDWTAQTCNPNGGDWQEEVYQKIQAMKDMYMQDLNDMHQKILAKLQKYDSLPQQPKNEQIEKLKTFNTNILERFMKFLQIPKHSIMASYKDKLDTYEKQIVHIINSNRRKPAPAQHYELQHQNV